MSRTSYLQQIFPALLLFMSVSAASAFEDPVSHTVGAFPAGVTIGDVDGDGLADVAVANAFSGDVSLLLNDGSGLGPEQRIASGGARYVAIEDIDGDGDRDLVVLVRDGNSVINVLRNHGDGSFALAPVSGTSCVPTASERAGPPRVRPSYPDETSRYPESRQLVRF